MVFSIKIKNFYSIADEVILDFTADGFYKKKNESKNNLINFNGDQFVNVLALFGSNAAGKSNIIKSIEFCRQLILNSHLNNEVELFAFEQFKFIVNQPSEFTINFENEGIEYEYSFALTKEKILSEALYYFPKKRRVRVFTRENTYGYTHGRGLIPRPTEVEANTGPKTLFLSRASSMNRQIAKTVYRFFLEGITVGDSDFDLKDVAIKEIEQNKELLLRGLSLSDSDIVDFRITDSLFSRPTLQTFHRENPSIPFNFETEESDGTKRLFVILLQLIKLASLDNTILFDEFDLKLHTHLAEFLIEVVMTSGRSQLVLTSHNPALINTSLFRPEQILFVSKDVNGGTEVVPLSHYEGFDKIKNPQQAYLQGRFDAIPYTGSPEYVTE